MSFVAAVDHLHALTQELSPTAPRRKFDLAHMRALAAELGNPQTRFPSILIAGTNGKGSTAATFASILAAAGYRTGLYTSPHLTRVTERIRISERQQATEISEQRDLREQSGTDTNDRRVHAVPSELCSLFPVPCPILSEIPEDTFARLYFQVDDAARRLVISGQLPHHPSFFEALTALAFLYFAEARIDIAVLEVGLGGRLDATNIVQPLLSVITDIALDHQDYLGSTLAEIAREKAGILRAEGTLITLPQHPDANQAIGEAAVGLNVRGVNAADYLPGREQGSLSVPCSLFPASAPLPLNHYDLHLSGETLRVRSPLAGQHQQRNLALAIAAAVELRNQHGYNIPNSAIEAGIAAAAWPGRLEFLPPDLLLDVAHNPAGAWALRAAISSLPDSQPRTLLFSCLRDKDLTQMARILFPLFDPTGPRPLDHIVLAPIDSPRAASLGSLLAAAHALDIPAVPASSPTHALELARSLTPPGGLIVATGSVYLIGAIRAAALAE